MTGMQTRGTCRVCRTDVAMRLDGTYRRHRTGYGAGSWCPGSLTTPPEDDAYRVAYEEACYTLEKENSDEFDEGFDAGWQRAIDYMRIEYGL